MQQDNKNIQEIKKKYVFLITESKPWVEIKNRKKILRWTTIRYDKPRVGIKDIKRFEDR